MYLRPYIEILPKTPIEHFTRGLETPTIIPIGATTKFITKHIAKGGVKAALAGAIGGTIIGAALFGGGGQEVKPVQTTTVTPVQETTQRQRMQAQLDMISRIRDIRQRLSQQVTVQPAVTPHVTSGSVYGIAEGASVTYAPVTTTITETITGVTSEQFGGALSAILQAQQQQATPTQTVTVTPTQTTEATKMDMGILGLIAVAGIALFAFMKRK